MKNLKYIKLFEYKENVKDSFYSANGVYINNIRLSPLNIKNFNLNKVFGSEIADIYSTGKNTKFKYGIFIIHIKDAEKYSKDNDYLTKKRDFSEKVDWFECDKNSGISIQDSIDYINKRL